MDAHLLLSQPRGARPESPVKAINKDAQAVLELLIEGLGGTPDDERASRKFDNGGPAVMAVTVERVGARRYSVAHYYAQNGDLMRDPEVVFWQGVDERFYPVEFTQDGMPNGYQALVEFDDAGLPMGVMVRQQRQCATFCATWMANIKEQQKLGRPRGRPPGAPKPPKAPPPAPSGRLIGDETDITVQPSAAQRAARAAAPKAADEPLLGESPEWAQEIRALGFPVEVLAPGEPARLLSDHVEHFSIGFETPAAPALDAREIETALIDPNPDQPRKVFEEQSLRDLADSIESSGLQQPIKVRPAPGGRFQIVCGERRWRAHVLLGRATVPAIIEEMSDAEMADAAIIENLQRADITPLEEARAFQRRLDDGLTVEELAKRLGLRQPHRITERTCLLKLFPEYQEAFARGDLRSSDAYELAQLGGDYQRAMFNAIRDGKCKTYGALRAVAKAFREAESNAIPVLVVQNRGTQISVFEDSGPTEAERAALTALEHKIIAVESLVSAGLKDNEVVIMAKVAQSNASVMAERLALICRQLDKLRLALLAHSAVMEAAQ